MCYRWCWAQEASTKALTGSDTGLEKVGAAFHDGVEGSPSIGFGALLGKRRAWEGTRLLAVEGRQTLGVRLMVDRGLSKVR